MKKRKKTALICALTLLLCGFLLWICRASDQPEEIIPSSQGEDKTEEPYFRLLVAGEDESGGLCDVLILLSIHQESGEVWGLQLPRDTYAAYSEGSYRKLNGAARILGGMEALCDFLEEGLGVSIHRYLRLSPDALRQGVDALGGVLLTLEEPMDYEDPAQGLSIHLPAGEQLLNGEAAEQFVRYRWGYARGDLDRLDAQKKFLTALYRRIKETVTPLTAVRLATSLMGEVETDLTLPDLTLLARLLFFAEERSVFLVTAPGEEATATQSGASYYVLSAKGMDELLSERFGGNAGAFDPKEVFLNDRYATFERIYRERRTYRIYSVEP